MYACLVSNGHRAHAAVDAFGVSAYPQDSAASAACTARRQQHWTAVKLPLPPDNGGTAAFLIETGSGTSWTPVEAPEPDGKGGISLQSVACGTECVITGSYASAAAARATGLELGSGDSWKASVAPLPKDADNPDIQVGGAACTTTCVVAGAYDGKKGFEGVIEVESGGNGQREAVEGGSRPRVLCPQRRAHHRRLHAHLLHGHRQLHRRGGQRPSAHRDRERIQLEVLRRAAAVERLD